MDSTRHYGDELELYVQGEGENIGLEILGTANSGAKNRNDSDLICGDFQIECKRTGSKTARGENYPKFKYKDWQKLYREAWLRNKTPALVIGSDTLKDSLVVIELSTYLALVAGSKE